MLWIIHVNNSWNVSHDVLENSNCDCRMDNIYIYMFQIPCGKCATNHQQTCCLVHYYIHPWLLNPLHDDVIKWKHFPRYWPFVREIHRSPVNSSHKGQWRGALMFSLICALNKRLSKQSWGWWFQSPSRSLWRHGDALIHFPSHFKFEIVLPNLVTTSLQNFARATPAQHACLALNMWQSVQCGLDASKMKFPSH